MLLPRPFVLKLFLILCCLVAGMARGMPQSTAAEITISSWNDLADRYEQFRDANYPLIIPGGDFLSYRSWEDVQGELTSFVKGSWFWYFPAACYRVDPRSKLSRIVRDKVDLLVYEDIYSGEIIIAAERRDGRYVEVYSRKTLPILEALALGMTTFEETSRRRIVWLPSVAPYDYVEPVEIVAASEEPFMRAMSVPAPPGGGTNSGGGGGLLSGMTPEQWNAIHSVSNMWLELLHPAVGNDDYVIRVYPSTNNPHNVDILRHTMLDSEPATWTLAAGNVAQNTEHVAVWTDSVSTASALYYRAADAEHDSDSDGIPDGRERFVYGTRTDLADSDGDGINDGQEILYGMNPNVADMYEDYDGDRFPAIYEILCGSAPNDSGSTPSLSQQITVGPGKMFSDIQSACDYAMTLQPDHVIIRVYPGTYAPFSVGRKYMNVGGSWVYVYKKILLISESGPGNTIIRRGTENKSCATVYDDVVMDGFTIENGGGQVQRGLAVYVQEGNFRMNHCIVKDNTGQYAYGSIYLKPGDHTFRNCLFRNNSTLSGGAVYHDSSGSCSFMNCTFLNNDGYGKAVYFTCAPSEMRFENCIVWDSPASGRSEFSGLGSYADFEISYSIMSQVPSGHTLSPDNTLNDPMLDSAGYLTSNSVAAINRGGDLGLTYDVDLDSRLVGFAPDIGADEFSNLDPNLDSDGDGLPDVWEMNYGLDPTSGIGEEGADGDPDSDGFRNIEEFIYSTHPKNVESTVSPVVYTYDDINRIQVVVYPDGNPVNYELDADGNITSVE